MICGHCGASYTPLVDEHDCFPEYEHQSCPPEEAAPGQLPLPFPGFDNQPSDDVTEDALRQLAREANKGWYQQRGLWDPQRLAEMPMEEYKAVREQLLPAMNNALKYQMLNSPRQMGKTDALRYITASFTSREQCPTI